MSGWMHLPRYVDKIRLHLAGKLPADYQANFGKGFDGRWLEAAGLKHEEFIEVVRGTVTDGEVADWVLENVHRTDAQRVAHREQMLHYPAKDDLKMQERLVSRKKEAGLTHRDDLTTFVDFIDADEKRK